MELRGAEAAFASPSHLLGNHEVGVLEDPHVFLDAIEGQTEWLRQLTDCGGMRREQLEDPAACRIREGEERAIQGVVIVHRSVHYNERG